MDFSTGKDRSRKKYSIFASFIVCCLGASLMISALATPYWFQSDLIENRNVNENSDVHFGLFSGKISFVGVAPGSYNTKIVCLDGDCMFSCGRNAELRKEQIRAIKNGTSGRFITSSCVRLEDSSSSASSGTLQRVVPVYSAILSSVYDNQGEEDHVFRNDDDHSSSSSTADPSTTTPEVKSGDPEFLSYGLWVGTISCLVIGMVFAVVGALFAVINTATTPVEFITGVPGLYIWNSMAALFNLLCVILWAVQFHQHLTNNVLYDTDLGWTTEGMEVFGYSFWLVVVAIIVHVANIVIIFVGTYERKVKEQVEKPEEKSVNLMLY